MTPSRPGRLLRSFSSFITLIFGKFSWQAPGWIKSLLRLRARDLLRAGAAVLLLLLLVAGECLLYRYWHLPPPYEVTWSVTPPSLPPIPDGGEMRPFDSEVTLTFSRSVARLDLIGRPVTGAIQLSFAMPGSWTWRDGSTLVFTPTSFPLWPVPPHTKEWPADTEITISLDKSIFNPDASVFKLRDSFRTPPLTAEIRDAQFYVNPADPTEKRVTATLVFSHRIDLASVKQNVEIETPDHVAIFGEGSGTHLQFNLESENRGQGRIVYLRSDEVVVPPQSLVATLTLPTSVVAAPEAAYLQDKVSTEVTIPSIGSLLQVTDTSVVLVQDKNNDPRRCLNLTTSIGVKESNLDPHLQAWMLPPFSAPAGSDQTQWSSPAQVSEQLLKQSIRVKLDPLASADEYGQVHSFNLEMPENRALYVRVDAGVMAGGGFILAHRYDAIAVSPPTPREVKISSPGALLALNGERKLTISSRGVEELEYRLARVNPGEIHHLVSQTDGTFPQPRFVYSYAFNESDLAEIIVRHQSMEGAISCEKQFSALDFSEFTDDSAKNKGKLGLFLLDVYAKNGDRDHPAYYTTDGTLSPSTVPGPGWNLLTDRRLILITDLGLVVKDNQDATHDLFVQSISRGEPVGDARVEVLGRNGLPVVTAETDGQGHASIPNLTGFVSEQAPVAYLVTRDQDVSFLPFDRSDRETNFSRFDVAGLSGLKSTDLQAFGFTDRGIYRPGDPVKLAIMVKQKNWRGDLSGLPLRLHITDPREQVVYTRPLRLDGNGFCEENFPTESAALTGNYQAEVYLAQGPNHDDEKYLGGADFKVKEFLPDRLKISTRLSKTAEGWISKSGLTAETFLQDLYGSAAVGHRVKATVCLEAGDFDFEKFPGYRFADPFGTSDQNSNRSIDLTEEVTDDKGHTSFDLDLDSIVARATRMTVLTEGFEKEGGRSVKAEASALLSSRTWLLGTKPDGDFNFLKVNSRRAVHLVAIDPRLERLKVDQVKVQRTKITYQSVLTQEPNGNFKYETVMKELPRETETISVPPEGFDYPLKTDEGGTFALAFFDEDGQAVGGVDYTVAAEGNGTQVMDKDAELSVKLSKSEYKADEEIEMEITAPYTGAGLITIEKDHVYNFQWFKTNSTTTIQKIRVPRDMEGNGYVNVSFVRALDAPQIYMSPLSYAVVPFQINREARHTKIDLTVPHLVVPGHPLAIAVKTDRPTEAVVYAVDEGILQVAGYSLPDPLTFFFQKQALEVGTRQTVDQILPEYSLARAAAAAGGGEAADLLKHHLNPFKRKHDAPVAYWSGIVDLGPQTKTFIYNVPDYFSGTIRVMVVAVSADAVGSTEEKLNVRGPFIISSNVPTFVAPGDTFDVGVTVANSVTGSGAAAPVGVKLITSSNLEVVQAPDPFLPIDEGRDATAHWIVKAKDQLGNADLTVEASLPGTSFQSVSHLSVRPPVPYLTTLASGYFQSRDKRIELTRTLYPQFMKRQALVSALPEGLANGLGAYLASYQNQCTEQVVSMAYPTLASSYTAQQGLSQAQVQDGLDHAFQLEATRQGDDGSFGLWQVTSGLRFDLPSVWMVNLLLEARERGFEIPQDMLTRSWTHLQQIADDYPTNLTEARVQAFAIYLLTRNDQVTTNNVNHLQTWLDAHVKNWQQDIVGPLLASTYALLQDKEQGEALMRKFRFVGATEDDDCYVDYYYNELARDGRALNLMAHHFPELLKTLTPDDLQAMVKPIIEDDYNTISAADAILGLDAYARTMSQSGSPGSAQIEEALPGPAGASATAGNEVLHGLTLSQDSFYPEAELSSGATAVVFHQPFPNPLGLPGLFYQVIQTGFDHVPITQPLSEGLEIFREYRDAQGNAVSSVKMGDELTVHIVVRGTGRTDWYDNIVVSDLLPGGFEVVSESIPNGPCSYGSFSYDDVREDRVLFYGGVSNTETIIEYKIKATNKGTYAVPPVQADSMYHLKMRARGVTGSLMVD